MANVRELNAAGNRAYRAVNEWFQAKSKLPNERELAEAMNVPTEEAAEHLNMLKTRGMLRQIENFHNNVIGDTNGGRDLKSQTISSMSGDKVKELFVDIREQLRMKGDCDQLVLKIDDIILHGEIYEPEEEFSNVPNGRERTRPGIRTPAVHS